MKTNFFTIAFSLISLMAGAQITITQNDLPFIGTLVGFVSDTTAVNVSPGASGANQFWNLSALQADDSGGFNFVDPVGAAGGVYFPNANLAVPDSVNMGATFFEKTQTSFDLHGAYSDFGYGPMALKYIPVEPWLTFPSVYQTTFSGITKYEIATPYSMPPIDSVKMISTTIYNSVIDGWGTITTPDFTAVSVLRQKFTEITIDSTFAHYYGIWAAVGTPVVDTVITYRWWSNEAKMYIAEMVSDPGGNVTKGTYLIDLSPFCTLVASASSTDETGYNYNDGTATATASGGITPYFYNWSNGASAATQTGLAPGTYFVTVSDAINCSVIDTVVVDTYVCAFSITASATNETSFNGNNGSATAVTAGGNAPFNYAWSNGGNSATITGLSPGIYALTVTDNNGCIVSGSATVNAYVCSFSVSAYSSDELSFNGNNGAATVATTGGTAPFTYAWSSGGNTATIAGLSPGNYTVIVTDTNNCVASDSVTVNAFVCTLSLSASTTNETASGANDGTATASASGGVTPYGYSWSTGDSVSSISNLSPGVYSVIVTDSANCTQSASVIVNGGGCVFGIDSIVAVDVLCHGNNTGALSVFLSGGTTPYSYSWNNGDSLSQISNLISQTYAVTVSDSGNCFADTSYNISEPAALSLSMVSTDVICNGNSDGTATATPSGGMTPYSYQWCTCAGSQTTQTATGLQAGNFYITITDANGCQKNSTITVFQPAALVLIITSNDASCNGTCDGSATANVAGGTTPYTFFWSNGDGLANSDSLCAGPYSVSVSDLNGCLQDDSVTINQTSPLQVVLGFSPTVVCEGDSTWISGIPSGGEAPYTYLWSNGSADSAIWVTSSQQYTVTVSDFYGCFITASGSHAYNSSPALTMAQTNILCNGACDGTAAPTVSGGTPPFTFVWDSPCLSCPMFYNICPGTYNYTVTDSNGCSSTFALTMTEPDSITLSLNINNISCNNDCDGSASAMVSGGTTPYSYIWSPQPGAGQGTANASQICAGTDSLIITDGNNCTFEASFSISEPLLLSLSMTATADSGNSNGTATVVSGGGTSPYSYSWTGGQSSATATGLASGMHYVIVTDANGCTQNDSVEVSLFIGISKISSLQSPISVYPNPVRNELRLQISLASSEKVEIVLINSKGQETELIYGIIEKGERELRFFTGNFAAGVYFLRTSISGSKPDYQRFVKME